MNKIIFVVAVIAVILNNSGKPQQETKIVEVSSQEHPTLHNCSLFIQRNKEESEMYKIKDSKHADYFTEDSSNTLFKVFYNIYNNSWDGCNCVHKNMLNICGATRMTFCVNPLNNSKGNAYKISTANHDKIEWISKVKVTYNNVDSIKHFDTSPSESDIQKFVELMGTQVC
jgi:hypothetical protein